MNKLPIEIENKIWNLYYSDIYKINIVNEIKSIMNYGNLFNNDIENIMLEIRKVRFDLNPDNVNNNNTNIKNDLKKTNDKLEFIIKNKSYYLLLKDIKMKIKHPSEIRPIIPENFYYICNYLIRKCNYRKKMFKILLKIINKGSYCSYIHEV